MQNLFYKINEVEYEIYEAASGDVCVPVEKYGEERADYNCGTLEKAYELILSDYRSE